MKIERGAPEIDSTQKKLKLLPKNIIGQDIEPIDTSTWGVIKYTVKEFYNKNPFLAWCLSAMLFFSILKALGKIFKR